MNNEEAARPRAKLNIEPIPEEAVRPRAELNLEPIPEEQGTPTCRTAEHREDTP